MCRSDYNHPLHLLHIARQLLPSHHYHFSPLQQQQINSNNYVAVFPFFQRNTYISLLFSFEQFNERTYMILWIDSPFTPIWDNNGGAESYMLATHLFCVVVYQQLLNKTVIVCVWCAFSFLSRDTNLPSSTPKIYKLRFLKYLNNFCYLSHVQIYYLQYVHVT